MRQLKHGMFGAAVIMLLPWLVAAAPVVLKADNNSGHDSVWVKRYAASVNSWGIVGDHVPGTNGDIWFNSFPGASGTYKVELGAVLEPDGNSRYRLSVDGAQVQNGKYPYSTGSLDCAASTLKTSYLDLGEHPINKGDKINLWGEAVYPCGTDHGQYTRWYELRFTLVAGPPADSGPSPDSTVDSGPTPDSTVDSGPSPDSTVDSGPSPDSTVDGGAPPPGLSIDQPKAATVLGMGTTITLEGSGGSGPLSWSYDANSDGLGEIDIGTGASVKFSVPTNIKGARKLTLFLAAGGDKVERTYDVSASAPPPPPPDSGAPPPPGDSGAPPPPPGDSGEPPPADSGAPPPVIDDSGAVPPPVVDGGVSVPLDGGSSAPAGDAASPGSATTADGGCRLSRHGEPWAGLLALLLLACRRRRR